MINTLIIKIGALFLKLISIKWLPIHVTLDLHIKTMFLELQESQEKVIEFETKALGSVIFLFTFSLLIAILSETGPVGAVYLLTLSVCISILPYFKLKKRIEERRFLIKKSLPDFINRLELLIEAGMPLSRAFELAAKSIDPTSPLSKEINRASIEIRNGGSEIFAYEQLAIRCRSIEVSRLSSMIIQNIRKGNSELATLLRMVASECWSARKILAKKKGEEAAAKLLIPVMLQLLAVLIVTAGPAVASLFQNRMG